MSEMLIRAEDLSVGFQIGKGLFSKSILKAVDNVSIHIEKGSFFGLVGESGSGKTTLGRALLRAVPITGGNAHYADGEVEYDIEKITKDQLRDIRGRNSVYHNNGIQTWWVKSNGEAENVEVS